MGNYFIESDGNLQFELNSTNVGFVETHLNSSDQFSGSATDTMEKEHRYELNIS